MNRDLLESRTDEIIGNSKEVEVAGKRCVLAGGTGFLGTALAEHLIREDYDVIVLSRSPSSTSDIRQIKWDGKTLGPWITALDGADAIVNLTGKSVICRYTPENQKEIVSSRLDPVKVLGEAIESCKRPPLAWVQCGSLAFYGDAGESICDEETPPGEGFSADTCIKWEHAFNSVDASGARKVFLRIGFVLGRGEGALGTLEWLTRFYLGGTVGNGRQYISWLGLDDLNRMFLWAIERPEIEGIFNATGPTPVTNAEFMLHLRYVLHRPWSPPVPVWAVNLGSKLMGIEPELALTGRRYIPKRFHEKGFEFRQTDLRETLKDAFFVQREHPIANESFENSPSR